MLKYDNFWGGKNVNRKEKLLKFICLSIYPWTGKTVNFSND